MVDAIAENDVNAVEIFFDQSGFSVNIYDLVDPLDGDVFESSLHCACVYQQIEVVKKLIEMGAEINTEDIEGITPLRIAVNMGNYEIAKCLLENGAVLDKRLLKAACKRENRDLLHLLVEFGARENLVDGLLPNLLLSKKCSFSQKTMDIANHLVTRGIADVNSIVYKENGKSTLIIAARKGHLPLVKLLVENGADINYYDNVSENVFLSIGLVLILSCLFLV